MVGRPAGRTYASRTLIAPIRRTFDYNLAGHLKLIIRHNFKDTIRSGENELSPNTALVIIDVQVGIFEHGAPIYRANEMLANLGALIGRAHAAGIPVIYIQNDGGQGDPLQPGQPGWQIHPAIAPTAGDLVIRKRTPDAFQGASLQFELDQRGVRHLVLGGLATEYCVDTSCRRAASLGYEVTLVQDGHGTRDSETLPASQIIAHHNQVLGHFFAALKPAAEVQF